MQEERKKTIIDILAKNYSVTVNELVKILYVSHATVRRDLTELSQERLIKKVYGGAVALKGSAIEEPLSVRQKENLVKKNYLGRIAANLIKDGSTLFLDSSSTCLAMTDYLSNISNLTIVTNGIQVLDKLSNFNHTVAFCCGGRIRENTKSLVGSSAIEYISRFNADYAFISCRGLSEQGILTDSSEEEVAVKLAFIKNAAKAVLLIDSEKFDKKFFVKIIDLSELDILISDSKPPKNIIELCEKYNVKILI